MLLIRPSTSSAGRRNLSTVLERILESVSSCAGWICLNERNGWKPFQVYYGLNPDSAVHPGIQCESNCYQSHIHHGQIQCTPNELSPVPLKTNAPAKIRVFGICFFANSVKIAVVGRLNAARPVGDPSPSKNYTFCKRRPYRSAWQSKISIYGKKFVKKKFTARYYLKSSYYPGRRTPLDRPRTA